MMLSLTCLKVTTAPWAHVIVLPLLPLVMATVDAFAFNPSAHIWIGPKELAALNMEGQYWEQLEAQAREPAGSPNLSDKDQDNDVYVLAKALVYVRCSLEAAHAECADRNVAELRNEVIKQVMAAMGTENSGAASALGRELAAYVIAADLVGLPPESDHTFRTWLQAVRHKTLEKATLISTHEERPDQKGTLAGASRAAIAVYLGDRLDLERTAQVLKGYLGDRSAYAGFSYRDLSWQCNPRQPVGINPKWCRKYGHNIDGVLPEDQFDCGAFQWPPCRSTAAWTALQGVLVQAVILHRAGYDVWDWQDRAILRAVQWLWKEADAPAKDWQPPLIDYFYGTQFWDGEKARPGKNMGWTGWTHARRGGGQRP
jgi:hypothetical protein